MENQYGKDVPTKHLYTHTHTHSLFQVLVNERMKFHENQQNISCQCNFLGMRSTNLLPVQ